MDSGGPGDAWGGSGQDRSTRRLGAVLLIGASALMAVGGAITRLTGADLEAALAEGEMVAYLDVVATNQELIVLNLSAWILGVFLFGAGAAVLARLCTERPTTAQLGLYSYWTGVPLAILSFVGWLALVTRVGTSPSSEVIVAAEIVGWWVTRADWVATVLVVGLGPLLLSLAGRDEWAPTWLVCLAGAAALAGVLTVVAMFAGGLTTYGQLIVPVGLAWTIAAGVVLWRAPAGTR